MSDSLSQMPRVVQACDGKIDEQTVLDRYRLVGGPDEMVPRLRRVVAACEANPAIAAEARREMFALFDGSPPVNIERWTTVPERELGEDVGAFNMMIALASAPIIAETHRRFGLPPGHLACTFSWFRPMIDLYRRRHNGVSGITHTRTFWFRKHADGQLFRFGTMEFLRGPVPDFVPASFRATLEPGDEVPTFHYPGGLGGLDPASIKASFVEATAFWKRAFGRYPRAWACDSWLFNPVWRELIPNSRIAHAIDLFEELPPLPYNPDEPSGLFFVYDRERCDPRDYPVTNSLERAFVTLYERGDLPVDGCALLRCDHDGRLLFRG